MTLEARILAAVQRYPGITSNGIYRLVGGRKKDILSMVEQTRQERLLRFETGKRGAKSWYVVEEPRNQFLEASDLASDEIEDRRGA